ncbi:MAG: hypothetical protein K2W95_05280 [Candidatus Obscuribacterales bacterium]|nr:hypothetical protein [Candidatus Obscuribacterales bacterium]
MAPQNANTCIKLPVIDVSPLTTRSAGENIVAAQIGEACRDMGFFYIVGHGIDVALQTRLEELSKKFFAQSKEAKMDIRMPLAGSAWRGYFPVGGELTSGKPDMKEGIYFGAELSDDHPMVKAGVPVHGKNLFPSIAGFRETVLEYLDAQTQLGHALMRGLALSLGLSESYFADRYTADPLILFRIFNYPYQPADDAAKSGSWGVGEHTDYGVLTILKQDDAGGLEVKSDGGWISAPPIENSFVCNIGDMLDRMTRGLYRSTPHRVRNPAPRDRLSFPFFFDPNFNAEVSAIEGLSVDFQDDKHQRWDRSSVHEISGTYGDYLLGKVSKVFPDLRRAVL